MNDFKMSCFIAPDGIDNPSGIPRRSGVSPVAGMRTRGGWRPLAAGAALVLTAGTGVAAAAQGEPLPPPGLYRIDASAASTGFEDCLLPEASPVVARRECGKGAPLAGIEGVKRALRCALGDGPGEPNFRKTGEHTWEVGLARARPAPVTALSDYDGTRGVLAARAKDGATASERRHAAAMLARIDEDEARERARGATPSNNDNSLAEPGKQGRRIVFVRLTRIAPACTAG